MSKYKSLIDSLRSSTTDEVLFTFADIEHLLGMTLPQSAYNTSAWWGQF